MKGRADGKINSQSAKLQRPSATGDIRARWDDKIGFLLKYGGPHLNEWEKEFLGSIRALREAGRDLTSHQSITLNNVFRAVSYKVG